MKKIRSCEIFFACVVIGFFQLGCTEKKTQEVVEPQNITRQKKNKLKKPAKEAQLQIPPSKKSREVLVKAPFRGEDFVTEPRKNGYGTLRFNLSFDNIQEREIDALCRDLLNSIGEPKDERHVAGIKSKSDAFFCPVEKKMFAKKPLKCSYSLRGTCEFYGNNAWGFYADLQFIKVQDDFIREAGRLLRIRKLIDSHLRMLVKSKLSPDQVILSIDSDGEASFKQLLLSGQPYEKYPDWLKSQQANRRDGEFIVLHGSLESYQRSENIIKDEFSLVELEGSPIITFRNKNTASKISKLVLVSGGLWAVNPNPKCGEPGVLPDGTVYGGACEPGEISICGANQGRIGMCPADVPMTNMDLIGVFPKERKAPYKLIGDDLGRPYTLIRIDNLVGKTLEITYRGEKFVGEIPMPFSVLAKKGSAIENAYKDLLVEMGIDQIKRQLLDCMAPTLKEKKCFENLVALKDSPLLVGLDRKHLRARTNADPWIESEKKYSLNDFYDTIRVGDNKLLEITKSCVTGSFRNWVINKDYAEVYKEGFDDFSPGCGFKKIQNGWILDYVTDGTPFTDPKQVEIAPGGVAPDPFRF